MIVENDKESMLIYYIPHGISCNQILLSCYLIAQIMLACNSKLTYIPGICITREKQYSKQECIASLYIRHISDAVGVGDVPYLLGMTQNPLFKRRSCLD